MTRRIWIAEAPPGVWSSGPIVIRDEYRGERGAAEDDLVAYERMGYEISGPFDLNPVAARFGGTPGSPGWPATPLPVDGPSNDPRKLDRLTDVLSDERGWDLD